MSSNNKRRILVQPHWRILNYTKAMELHIKIWNPIRINTNILLLDLKYKPKDISIKKYIYILYNAHIIYKDTKIKEELFNNVITY